MEIELKWQAQVQHQSIWVPNSGFCNKEQIDTIIDSMEAVEWIEVLKSVTDNSGGHHLDVFFLGTWSAWNAVTVDPKFYLFVLSAINKYIALVWNAALKETSTIIY